MQQKCSSKKQLLGIILFVILIAAVAFVFSPLGQSLIGRFNHATQTNTPPPDAPPQQSQTEKSLACIAKLPNSIKIGQKLLFAAYSDQLPAEIPVLVANHIGGVIVMTAATVGELTDLRNAMDIAPIIGVDQEGGPVQRYKSEGLLPSAQAMATNYSANQAYDAYLTDDKYLQSLGLTTNFAPVVDVMSGENNPLPGRMYSSHPNSVAEYAGTAVRAANDAGLTPVIKHFPGLGSATGNTDYGSATTDPLSVLKTRDLIPYQKLASSNPDVMVSNAIIPELTNGQPAVWSPEAVQLLREMGYQNAVVYTDSLTAKAIPGTLGDAVVKTWLAGTDIAMIVQTAEDTPYLSAAIQEIVNRVMTALQSSELNQSDINQSLLRIFTRKGINPCDIQL